MHDFSFVIMNKIANLFLDVLKYLWILETLQLNSTQWRTYV
jgi:hypothetical protein